MLKFELAQHWDVPTLEGTNLVLRPCELNDFSAILAYRQDPDNARFIRPVESAERIQEIVESHAAGWKLDNGKWNCLVLCEKNNSHALGEIVFRVEDFINQRAEIGYRLSRHCAGKGYATIAAGLLMDYLFVQLGFNKVVAKCDPENVGSFRVMEKLGMRREALFKRHYLNGETWTDQLDYGILSSEWLALRESTN